MITYVETIAWYERLNNSANGNPRYRIHFEDGPAAITMSDAGFCYELGNPELREGTRVRIEYTAAGRIRHMAREDKNYAEDDYQRALRVAAFMFDPTEPPNMDTTEYARGVVNLLADLYPKIEMPVSERMDEVQRDLTPISKAVWEV